MISSSLGRLLGTDTAHNCSPSRPLLVSWISWPCCDIAITPFVGTTEVIVVSARTTAGALETATARTSPLAGRCGQYTVMVAIRSR
jgi:hypothetical protein